MLVHLADPLSSQLKPGTKMMVSIIAFYLLLFCMCPFVFCRLFVSLREPAQAVAIIKITLNLSVSVLSISFTLPLCLYLAVCFILFYVVCIILCVFLSLSLSLSSLISPTFCSGTGPRSNDWWTESGPVLRILRLAFCLPAELPVPFSLSFSLSSRSPDETTPKYGVQNNHLASFITGYLSQNL